MTGASGGQGAAEARLFAQAGARVILADVQDELGEAQAQAIRDAGGDAHYRHLDVADQDNWHRVIDGFMAQTGDPKGVGIGGSGQNIKAEFSGEAHVRGTVSMARSQKPDSADSQFFIVFAPSSWLDRQYTVWGQVAEGMDFVDQIKKGDGQSGRVKDPDVIVRMQVAADAE